MHCHLSLCHCICMLLCYELMIWFDLIWLFLPRSATQSAVYCYGKSSVRLCVSVRRCPSVTLTYRSCVRKVGIKKSKVLSRALRPMGRRWSPFHSPQPDTSRSRKTTDTGPVHRVVCPFTPQLSLVLINRPRRDGMLSWRWYTAAVGGIRTRDLAIASPAPYHSATVYHWQ